MKRPRKALMLSLALLAATSLAHAAEADVAAVEKAAADFYQALNSLFAGEAAQMKEVWSHAEDVTYMGPMGGLEVGWAAVQAVWESQAALELGGRVVPAEMRIHVGRDLAVTYNYEVGENVVDGETKRVSIRATNVFRKEDGQWKMIGHQTDLLPYLAE